MPPKRLKVAPKGDDSVPKKKTSPMAVSTADGKLDSKFQWQLEEKPGCWVLFDDETQKALTTAYNNNDEQCEVDDGDFVVMLRIPTRKTKKTGYQKRVRIGKTDEKDNQVITWSWEDRRKRRHYYSVDSFLDLESNRDETSLDIFSENKSCNVNVKEMKHSNSFEMFRELADAKPAPVVSKPPSSLPAAKSKGKSAASKAAADLKAKDTKSASKADVKEEKQERTVVVKGKAPVDSECFKAGTAHVYYSGKDIWDCMLNQTNLQNNNNKYYLIQLLEDDNSSTYSVWMRWGRVGKKGQTAHFPCGPDLEDAMKIFSTKFKDKTKNDWASRGSFTKVPGKYDLLEMDYDTKVEDEVDSVKKPSKPLVVPNSKLDSRLQELMKLIADVKAMEEAVVEMKYDAKKAPLGKLTKAQIRQGYSALKDIEKLINENEFGFKLTEACNAFYTRIPHDFGMKAPERIVSLEILKSKMTLLEALGDIEIAVKVLESGDRSINPIDRNYISLECDIKPMDRSDKAYKTLERYLLDTHAVTHNQYSLELLDIFECEKDEGDVPDIGNKMLLWHGSRLTNWVGILAKGLRIAPPEAPSTGYMFGKGVYFADCSSKSANYCFPTRTKNVGLLLLNEVALGKPNELLSASYEASKLPKGKHSVKGCGKMAPDPSTFQTIDDVVVPQGKLKDTGVTNPAGYTLQYNEYIVYNTNQIKMKYLMKVKFNFKY